MTEHTKPSVTFEQQEAPASSEQEVRRAPPQSLSPDDGPASLSTPRPQQRQPQSHIQQPPDDELDWEPAQTFRERTKRALHKFFYPPQRDDPLAASARSDNENDDENGQVPDATSPADDPLRPEQNGGVTQAFDEHFEQQEEDDKEYVHSFWTTYDDILMLSLLTQVGIVFRLGASTWFTYFDNVFTNDSALFINLPLNCFSCFMMGLLCSGERLMEIIGTRFTPPHLQQELQQNLHDDTEQEEDEIMLVESDEEGSPSRRNVSGILRRRRKKQAKKPAERFHSWQPPLHLHDELRDVQLLALERRIRASKCLVLFPIKKEDVDVMEHYFHDGYKRRDSEDHDYDPAVDAPGDNREISYDLALEVEFPDEDESESEQSPPPSSPLAARGATDDKPVAEVAPMEESKTEIAAADSKPKAKPTVPKLPKKLSPSPQSKGRGKGSPNKAVNDDPLVGKMPNTAPQVEHGEESESMHEVDLEEAGVVRADQPQHPNTSTPEENENENENENDQELHGESQYDLDQIIHDVSANVTENVSRLRRVDLAEGWDVGTTPDAMSDDLMLGLRDGFCGAVSSFSSWNSAMVNLMRGGQVGEALVGYTLGLQLPIVAYRFGQTMAVYIFIWRARFETKRDERRGYGIRLSTNDTSERDSLADEDEDDMAMISNTPQSNSHRKKQSSARVIPSGRAIITAIFVLALVTQCTALSFFNSPEDQQLALSLLFSPLGVLARWRLSKYNNWRPSFPIGTFSCNILACALSGGLGSLLAGNPGDRQRVVLVSVIAGFAGTLSSLATFIVEVLAGVDPILLRFDGMIYAVLSILWALVTGFLFSASADWADTTD